MQSNTDTFLSTSEIETVQIGEQLLEKYPEHNLFLLNGDLGSGKTVLTKGLAKSLSINPEKVKSPTYAFYNVYNGVRSVYHFDLYKLTSNMSTQDIMLEIDEILDYENNFVIIEWATRIPDFKCKNITIELSHESNNNRLIKIKRNG